ncbi:ABC transporter ATP-binding protein/permease [Clostridium gasigenes]|uniref:ABC transporter ATP-binding protein/permease n=1 Tax=Clostridium gasigenes TaxID=94869 RepID=UPI001C0CB312|nr:ABC transporter ATP-binding protein/permease [Clostridium gasigenes]MBU3107072.1 ATP-binding cassette domain-containing protein [Clostridium gasigenes]
MLQIKNLKKSYKIGEHEIKALDDVTFELASGKLVAIVGPSGCGKTTLMNILGALDGDFEGDVIINGKSLKEAGTKDLDSYRKNTIGFIFQQFNLLNSQTSKQNVELALDLSGISKKDRSEKVKYLLERVGLLDQIKKRVNLLSGGQRQRVAIARALANDPDIILADEPTGALDAKTGEKVMDLLKEISKERLILMVTHSPEIAEAYADLIINMEDGKIISIDENLAKGTETEIIPIKKEETKSKMSVLTALKLSLRNAWIKKGRTLATAIGTSIGIAGIALAIAITSGTTNSVNTQVRGIFPTNSVMVGYKENIDKNPNDIKKLGYEDIEEINSLDNEFYAYQFPLKGEDIPMMSFYSLEEDLLKAEDFFNKLSEEDTIKRLIDMMSPGIIEDVKDDIQYGTVPNEGELNEFVISLSTAKNIIKDDEKLEDLIGKNIYVSFVKQTSHSDKMRGRGKPPEIIVKPLKISGIANTTTLMNTYYVSSDWNIKYYEKEFNLDKKKMEASSMIVYGKSAESIEASVEKLDGNQDKYQFEMAGKTITKQIESTMKQVRMGLMGFAGVSIVVAVLMISIVIYISVLERTNEIGILRAIGARSKDIMNIFVAESFIIGILSAIIGIGISIGISNVINNLVYKFLGTFANNAPYMEVAKLPLKDAGLILLFCATLSIISGLYPSLKASKMDPIDALKRR